MFIRWKTAGRVAGFLLLALFLLTMGPSGAEAGPGAVTAIGSAQDLLAFAESVNGGESYAGRTVTLTADIDLAGQAFTPIGRPDKGMAHVFQGTFDGGGHAITGLAVTGGVGGSAGLFAELHNATVQNLSLEARVSANDPCAVGALTGWMVNGTVQNVLVNAQVTAADWSSPEDGCAAVGIIAGKATGRTVLDHVAARGSAAGAGAFRWAVYVGGIIGYIQGGGSIANCYTTAVVFCNDAGVYAGGFFGGAVDPPPVANSYAAAFVTGGRATSGAFAGYAQGGSAANVWYDKDLAGTLEAVGAPGGSPLGQALKGESTGIMQDSAFPSRLGGAFAQAGPDQNLGYPVFRYEAPAPEPSATPEPSPEPTATPKPSPEPTATPTPSPEPTSTPTPSPEPTATPEPSPEPTATPKPSPEPTSTPEPSPEPTSTPEPSPEPTSTPEPSPEPTSTPEPSPEPTATPKPSPEPTSTPEPSPEPTATPKPSPVSTATPKPSPVPTATPEPSPEPTATPKPSPEPTSTPEPSPEPTSTPKPSLEPTSTPEPSPEPTSTPEPSPEPTATPEPSPEPTSTPEPSPEPTATPALAAALTSAPDPTGVPSPTPEPSPTPGPSPTEEPVTPTPEPDPTPTPAPDPTGTPDAPTGGPAAQIVPVYPGSSQAGTPDVPRTGDDSGVMFWLAALALCAIGLAYATVKRQ